MEWKGKEKEIMPWEGRVTLVSGLVLVLLLIAFVFMTILNTYRLMEQLEQISEHPFRVLGSASILQNDLERIQVYTERLQYNNDPDMVAEVREQIETIYLEVEEHLQIVEERYLGEHSEVAALREQLERLKTANEQLFQYAAAEERSESEIVAFTQQEIHPARPRWKRSSRASWTMPETVLITIIARRETSVPRVRSLSSLLRPQW